jgi:formate/nitrite transporter FocA (FNT family)
MDWKKLGTRAANYAADGAAEKTVDFALTKVGPYRVAGIIAKSLMLAGILLAVMAGFALTGTYAGVAYIVAAIAFGVGLLINTIRNIVFRKAKAALTTGAGWAADQAKKRFAEK